MIEREGEWVEYGGIRMFMYDIDAPDYTNKPDTIRQKLNFEYKMELLDNKTKMKSDKDIFFCQMVCVVCAALLAATIFLLKLINQFIP